MRKCEWEGMGINILLWEGMGMLLYITIWEWDGNEKTVIGMGSEKVIPAHLYFKPYQSCNSLDRINQEIV